MQITEELKAEILREYKFMKKGKNTFEILADLYGLKKKEVEDMVKEKRAPAFSWTPERVHRLRAYIAQGMGNTEIAKELCCKPQCIADFKRTHKEELLGCDIKKKEPTIAGTTADSKKKTDAKVNSSINNYTTNEIESQDLGDMDIWYAKFFELSSRLGDITERIYEMEAILTATVDAGRMWSCVSDATLLARYCDMNRILSEKALASCRECVKMVEST